MSRSDLLGLHRLDMRAVATPPAHHLFHLLSEHLGLLDLELASDRVVVELARTARRCHVEPRQVAAGRASVAGSGHGGESARSTSHEHLFPSVRLR